MVGKIRGITRVHYFGWYELRKVLLSIAGPEAGLEDRAADGKSQHVKLHS